jgi:2-polyprenyl-3-methyl-5-hydroxy-6-metoxy-1,4-benzoquinol methylase
MVRPTTIRSTERQHQHQQWQRHPQQQQRFLQRTAAALVAALLLSLSARYTISSSALTVAPVPSSMQRHAHLQHHVRNRRQQHHHHRSVVGCLKASKKGLGSGGDSGFGSTASTNNNSNNKKALLKQVQRKYGGSTAQEIAAGTQRCIERALKNLPPHLQAAAKLYQNLRQWDAHVATLSILEQTRLFPPGEVEGAQRARGELDRICSAHNVTEIDLHNLFQRITWDASADAKAARAVTGSMPVAIADRIDRACRLVAGATKTTMDDVGGNGTCLDVGCGFGTLVPNLMNAGLHPHQIYGVDLSQEMIRNAMALYPECNFQVADFLDYTPGGRRRTDHVNAEPHLFDSILFCSALHDTPDQFLALHKAGTLLRPGGTVVIVHAQGAAHVNQQVQSNPVLVRRGLPDANELEKIGSEVGMTVLVKPANAKTPKDLEEGYLAVLQKN